MIRILCIGNSFSQDATTYLHDMALCGGVDSKVVNLYIPGCPLKTHWENIRDDRAAYDYQLNGADTGRKISIRQALAEESWDFVTMQQASHDSGLAETYEPYLRRVSEYVRRQAPRAVQLIHETWAYEIGSSHSAFPRYGSSQATMYRALRAAYRQAAADIRAAIIPCGDVVQALRALPEFDVAHGGQTLCRDGFHMHLIYGRYAAAATFYETVMHGDIRQNRFVPVPADAAAAKAADPRLLTVIAGTVHSVCGETAGQNRP